MAAVFVMAVLAILFHKKLSHSWTLLKIGIDKAFLVYLGEFRKTGWETFWAPTVAGIIFGLVTLWYSPARLWFLVYLLFVVFVTGYYLWRPNYNRLVPRIALISLHKVYTPTNVPGLEKLFVQLLVRCASDESLIDCQGQLLRVWVRNRDRWEPTDFDEPLDLQWSIRDALVTNIEPGLDRRLNIVSVGNLSREISVCTDRTPMRMQLISEGNEFFKFDVRVSAKGISPRYASLKIDTGEHWDSIFIGEIVDEQ